MIHLARRFLFFFFNDTATTEIYTLSLHDALPISRFDGVVTRACDSELRQPSDCEPWEILDSLPSDETRWNTEIRLIRSEEHTSELQSRQYLVCRLLLEKKKTSMIR